MLLACCAIGPVAGHLQAQTSDVSLLRGVTNVAVIIEDADNSAFDSKQVALAAEGTLREVDIEIVKGARQSFLYIAVSMLPLDNGLYAFIIKVELIQRGYLARDPKLTLFGSTWEKTKFGTTGQPAALRFTVQELVDSFAKDYAAANPRR
jgi:hypothetical protein